MPTLENCHPPQRVLVIDDEPEMRELIGGHLTAAGFQPLFAADAASARACLARERPDLVVLDLGLPDMDGLDLAPELLARGGFPLLIVSARAGANERAAGLELGADDYLGKPFEPRELIARVRALLRRNAPTAAEASPPVALTGHGPVSRCHGCQRRLHCLGRFEESLRATALEGLIQRRPALAEGTNLYLQGERMRALYVVREGLLKRVVEHADGSAMAIGFHYPGDWLGFDGIGDGRHAARAEALEASEVCVLPWPATQALARREPEAQRHLLDLIGLDMLGTQRHLAMMDCAASRRLALFLLEQRERWRRLGGDPDRIELAISRSDIASYLGLAEETVSRQFSRLQSDGILGVERRSIHILDRRRLADHAGIDGKPSRERLATL